MKILIIITMILNLLVFLSLGTIIVFALQNESESKKKLKKENQDFIDEFNALSHTMVELLSICEVKYKNKSIEVIRVNYWKQNDGVINKTVEIKNNIGLTKIVDIKELEISNKSKA